LLVAEVVDHQFALIHRHLAARTLLQQLLRCFDLVDVDALRVHEAKMIAFDDHHAGTIDVGRFRHHVTEPPEHVLHLERAVAARDNAVNAVFTAPASTRFTPADPDRRPPVATSPSSRSSVKARVRVVRLMP
jgi:hypothetical protein